MAGSFSMVDANGNPSKSGPNAKMNICDSSYTPYVCNNNQIVTIPTQYCTTYQGEAADWAFERDNTFRIIPFGTSIMKYDFAYASDRNTSVSCPYELHLTTPGAQYTNWWLYSYSGCGGNLMADAAIGNRDTHGDEINMHFYSDN